MTTPDAKRIAITLVSLTGVLAVVNQVQDENTPDVPRLLIGVILTSVALVLIAEPLPELAAMLALLILLATLFGAGPDLIKAISRRAKTSRQFKQIPGSVLA